MSGGTCPHKCVGSGLSHRVGPTSTHASGFGEQTRRVAHLTAPQTVGLYHVARKPLKNMVFFFSKNVSEEAQKDTDTHEGHFSLFCKQGKSEASD